MKICILGTRGFPKIQGGVEKHCENLYPLFSSEYNFIVFRRKSYVEDKMATYPNLKFIDLPSTKIKGLEAVLHSFLSSIYTVFIRPDIAHYHNIGPALFSPIVRLFGIKVVLTYHSPNYEHKKWGWFAKHLLLLSEKIALSTANKIIFVNKFQMQKYNAKIKSKSLYIPNGIPSVKPSANTDYLESMGLKPNRYIISVGRITPEKGFDTLILAYNEAKSLDYKLVIAGGVEAESSYGDELKKLVANKEVVFTGYVYGEKLNQLYTNAALYVLASNNEGFPLVLLEAMSYNLDVLVSDIPASHLVNLPIDNYFEKGNTDMLSQKISEKVVNHKKMQYELSDFDWAKISDKVSEVYDSVKLL
jgi:glycosyltransferase involved in cell wall biosynthesis